MTREKYIYKIESSDEYICVNVTYEVSPDNKWYYSENGMIFKKDDAGLLESARFYRVQKARIDN